MTTLANRKLPGKYLVLMVIPWAAQLIAFFLLISLMTFLSEHSVDYFITIPGFITLLMFLYLAILVPEVILIFTLNVLSANGFKTLGRVLAVVRPSLVASALLLFCGHLIIGFSCIVITFANMRMIGNILGRLDKRQT